MTTNVASARSNKDTLNSDTMTVFLSFSFIWRLTKSSQLEQTKKVQLKECVIGPHDNVAE